MKLYVYIVNKQNNHFVGTCDFLRIPILLVHAHANQHNYDSTVSSKMISREKAGKSSGTKQRKKRRMGSEKESQEDTGEEKA